MPSSEVEYKPGANLLDRRTPPWVLEREERERPLRLRREAMDSYEHLSSRLRKLADRIAKAYLRYRLWRVA